VSHVADAVAALRAGQVIGLPTETVYGLAGDARSPRAIVEIYRLKGRPPGHPLIVHLHNAEQLTEWATDIPAQAWALANTHWPGPLTLVLKRAPGVLDQVTGGQPTIALRVPRHPVARAVLEAFGGGLAAPSANRYQNVSPTTAAHVRSEFGEALPIVLDGGASEIGIESSIVDFSGAAPRVLRLGMLDVRAFGGLVAATDVRAPGSDARHYAPLHPARLIASAQWQAETPSRPIAALGFSPIAKSVSSIVAPTDAVIYAQNLYRWLRELGALDVAEIWIEAPPDTADWAAVNDRLRRATTQASV
jgi:L-threonylcarbamoyladenylate synthase